MVGPYIWAIRWLKCHCGWCNYYAITPTATWSSQVLFVIEFQRMEKLSTLLIPANHILVILSFDGDVMMFRAVAFHITSLGYLYGSTLDRKRINSYNKSVTKVFVHWKEHPPDEDFTKIHLDFITKVLVQWKEHPPDQFYQAFNDKYSAFYP